MSITDTVRPLMLGHTPAIAHVHCLAFPKSALTRLGVEPVRRYYDWLMQGPHDAVALGSFVRNALSGFVRQNRAFLIRHVVMRPWLLANPLFRERLSLANRLLHGATTRRNTTVSQVQVQRSAFSVLAIATHPQYRRRQVGAHLMEVAEQIARARGFWEMRLSVHPDNGNAIRFYEHLGWRKDEQNEFWNGKMVKSLDV
jgi:GNAT superfamily N-acetyltransferase